MAEDLAAQEPSQQLEATRVPTPERTVSEILAKEGADQALINLARDFQEWHTEQRLLTVEQTSSKTGETYQRPWGDLIGDPTYRTADGRMEIRVQGKDGHVYLLIGAVTEAGPQTQGSIELNFRPGDLGVPRDLLSRAYVNYRPVSEYRGDYPGSEYGAAPRTEYGSPNASGNRQATYTTEQGVAKAENGDPIRIAEGTLQALKEGIFVGGTLYDTGKALRLIPGKIVTEQAPAPTPSPLPTAA